MNLALDKVDYEKIAKEIANAKIRRLGIKVVQKVVIEH